MEQQKYNKLIFYGILLLATLVRIISLGNIPAGLSQDEAFNGYEAINLMNYGKDSWNYRFPIYFISWASGTSVLYSYITIPFFKLFGISDMVLHIPQALLGILSCYIFYRILRTCCNHQIALLGFFLIAITPWHIILSRNALEIHITPFFTLAGFYFFIKAFKKNDYLLLSALFYGLGLYTYATCWFYITITFGFQLLYLLLYQKNKNIILYILSAGIVFCIFAIPILALILTNNSFLPEIETNWFSIPKLIVWRQREINLDLGQNFITLIKIIISGQDSLLYNTLPIYGLYYPISVPFIIIGLYYMIKSNQNNLKIQQPPVIILTLINTIIGLICASLIPPCINRANYLWFNFIFIITIGISSFKSKKLIQPTILLIYTVFFLFFCHIYFTKFNQINKHFYTPDLKPTLALAEKYHQQTGNLIYILESPSIFPKVLFYSQIPLPEYRKTVHWQQYPLRHLDAATFTHYRFHPHFDYNHIDDNVIYIAPVKQKYYFYQFNTTIIGDYIVAVPKP